MDERSHDAAVVNRSAARVEVKESPGASDAALVARAAGGDDEAFALLYHRYKHDAWRLASFKLRDAHEAEDVMQETFLRAYRGLRAFRGGESVRPWLLTICRNACMDRVRVRLARGTVFLEDRAGPEPVSAPGDVDGGIDLRRALSQLPPEDVEAFFFVDVLGLHSHEAAAVLGLGAPSTLRSRLTRARHHLADALAEAPPRSAAAEVWGVLHTPPLRALVVSHGGATAPAPVISAAPRGATELVRFFDVLEHRIPAGRSVLAQLGGPATRGVDAAAPWIAHHPRWRLRLSSADSWQRDAERVLGDDVGAPALARLRGCEPFVWTPTR